MSKELFSCSDCHKPFSSESSMNQHVQARHSEKESRKSVPQKELVSPTMIGAVVALVIIALLGYFLFSSQPVQHAGVASSLGSNNNIGLEVGQKAPDFSVTATDGKTVRLSDYASDGKAVVVEFMATWCPHCRNDLSAVRNVYPSYQDRVGFLAVSLDPTENAQILQHYAQSNHYPVTFAPGNQSLLYQYQVQYTTTKYGIGKDGTIKFKTTGEQPDFVWKNQLDSLLG